ncbi:MAG TPA: type 4a pilus biogenesis protein PilO [Candidatus Omnitrophota bacterium]|nr:type 4a pilus biogenesis protein PilO [Candidatus Omnitrophota bacterium]
MDPKLEKIADEIRDFLQDEKKRAYAAVSAAAVFAALYGFFLVVPTVKNLGNVSKNSLKISKKIDMARKDLENTGKLEKKLESLREEFSSYASQVPGTKEIAAFLDSLAVVAKDSNVRIISVTPMGVQAAVDKSADLYPSMMVVISAKGGYHQMRHFIGELEKGKGFPSVRDIRLQYDPKSPTRHDAHIVLKIYISQKGGKDAK